MAVSIEPIAYTRKQAAAALGMSLDSFERHVQHELRIVRKGSLRLVPRSELERWIAENASFVLED